MWCLIVSIPDVCNLSYFAFISDLTANFGEAIVIGICCLLTVISWIIYYAQLRSRYYKFKDVSKRFKTLTLLGLYPVSINRLFAYCKGGNLIFISGRGSAISSAKQGKSGSIYNLAKK